jgi:hypothetical protein
LALLSRFTRRICFAPGLFLCRAGLNVSFAEIGLSTRSTWQSTFFVAYFPETWLFDLVFPLLQRGISVFLLD